jgi:transcriptional regulator with XRE-family HTH domain
MMQTKQMTIPAKVVEVTFAQYVGQRMRQRRVELGLTQDAIVEVCDISKAFLSECENGKRSIGFCKLFQLAKVLKRPADWFAKGWD